MLPTIARFALPKDFRHIDTASARIVLIEGGPRLLPAFPEDLSAHAKADLIELGGRKIVANTVFWAAGNAASPIGATIGAALDRMGRVVVKPDLSVVGHPEIFVVGDLAVLTSGGKPVPGVAPAALRRRRCRAAVRRRATSSPPCAGKGARCFAIVTRAIWRRLAVTVRWEFWLDATSPAPWPGGLGSWSTSCTWQAFEIASASCSSGDIHSLLMNGALG
jgi:hypothetical protein